MHDSERTIMTAADTYARAVATQRDDWRSASPHREALEAEVRALAAEVERLREALAYEHGHTLDDATKHRIGEVLA